MRRIRFDVRSKLKDDRPRLADPSEMMSTLMPDSAILSHRQHGARRATPRGLRRAGFPGAAVRSSELTVTHEAERRRSGARLP